MVNNFSNNENESLSKKLYLDDICDNNTNPECFIENLSTNKLICSCTKQSGYNSLFIDGDENRFKIYYKIPVINNNDISYSNQECNLIQISNSDVICIKPSQETDVQYYKFKENIDVKINYLLNSNNQCLSLINSNPITTGQVNSNPMITGQVNSNPMITGQVNSNPMITGQVNSNPMITGQVNSNIMSFYLKNTLDKNNVCESGANFLNPFVNQNGEKSSNNNSNENNSNNSNENNSNENNNNENNKIGKQTNIKAKEVIINYSNDNATQKNTPPSYETPPPYGIPFYETPSYEIPSYGSSFYGSPFYGSPSYGSPSYGSYYYGSSIDNVNQQQYSEDGNQSLFDTSTSPEKTSLIDNILNPSQLFDNIQESGNISKFADNLKNDISNDGNNLYNNISTVSKNIDSDANKIKDKVSKDIKTNAPLVENKIKTNASLVENKIKTNANNIGDKIMSESTKIASNPTVKKVTSTISNDFKSLFNHKK